MKEEFKPEFSASINDMPSKAALLDWMSNYLYKYNVVIATAGPGEYVPLKRIKIFRGKLYSKEIQEKENELAFDEGVEYMETIIVPKVD